MHLILRRGKNGAYLCAKCGERLLQAFAHFLFPTFPTHCYYCYISNLKILYYKIQKYIITINRCAKLGKWQRCLATMKPNLEINWTSLTHLSKRYRNRRLGEYLKELDLTEGRSTGIPTIQNVLENNGSPRATVVTDDERTFFRITIPCHEAAGNIIADIAHKDESLKASKRGSLKTTLQSALESALQTAPKSAPKSALKIIEQISNNPRVTMTDIANLTGYSRRWVAQTIKRLQEHNIIKRIGSDKSGHWEIIGK